MAARSLRALAAVTALALPLAACGLGDKEAYADAIVDATDRAFDSGTVSGTLAVSMQVIRFPDGMAAFGGVQLGGDMAEAAQDQAMAESQALVADVVLDLERDRASVQIPGTEHPFVLFDGMEAYGRRYDAGERDARPWVRVDLADLDDGGSELSPTEDQPFIGGYAISPVALLELASGPLTGSIERASTDEIDGVPVTRYDANFDIEKVLRDTRRSAWPEDRRDAFEDVLDVLAVRGSTHEGQVWLDDDGNPRRFKLRLREEPIRKFLIDVIIQLDLTTLGAPAAVDVPTAQERIDLTNVVQFLRSVVPSPTDQAAFARFLGIELPEATPPVPTTDPTADTTTTTTTAPAEAAA
jgi:hypothetical protein